MSQVCADSALFSVYFLMSSCVVWYKEVYIPNISSEPLSLYILYVNVMEVHGNQRNGVRWLYELGTICIGSVCLVLVDGAFNRGRLKVRRH